MQFINEIVSFIVGALAGGISVKWYSVRNANSTVLQKDIKAGGDFAGRDIKK